MLPETCSEAGILHSSHHLSGFQHCVLACVEHAEAGEDSFDPHVEIKLKIRRIHQ